MPAFEPPQRSSRPIDARGIAVLRDAAGLSQAELGAILGVEEAAVSRLETGRRRATRLELDVLMVLSDALAPMVNAEDAKAWARGIARLAEEVGPFWAGVQMFAHEAARRRARAQTSESRSVDDGDSDLSAALQQAPATVREVR